ncbi:uncharacterized protein METZ01_LOCUS243254, partial [marine metagenome]
RSPRHLRIHCSLRSGDDFGIGPYHLLSANCTLASKLHLPEI